MLDEMRRCADVVDIVVDDVVNVVVDDVVDDIEVVEDFLRLQINFGTVEAALCYLFGSN